MKLLISIILIAGLSAQVWAQNNMEEVLQEIEKNNLTLSALRKQKEAQQLGNRTGIFLTDPEVEFNYLWGNPSAIGERKDLSITQSFDFPTAYGHRGKISRLENASAELVFKQERIDLLLSAKQICIELIYYNRLAAEYTKRLDNAASIAGLYERKLAAGDASIIESNKARLNHTAVETEFNRMEEERLLLLSSLEMLNGGMEIQLAEKNYPPTELPESFDEWIRQAESNSPMLRYVNGRIDINRQQVKLEKAMALPRFSAGYMSEKVVGESFRGISAGATIPLWENKNRVKQARAGTQAAEAVFDDTRARFYNNLSSLHLRASTLSAIVKKYRASFDKHNNEPLLKKAFDTGEISLLDYLQEIEYYYDAMNKILEAERDLELAIAELKAVEL